MGYICMLDEQSDVAERGSGRRQESEGSDEIYGGEILRARTSRRSTLRRVELDSFTAQHGCLYSSLNRCR